MKIAGPQRCRCVAARAEIALALFLISYSRIRLCAEPFLRIERSATGAAMAEQFQHL